MTRSTADRNKIELDEARLISGRETEERDERNARCNRDHIPRIVPGTCVEMR